MSQMFLEIFTVNDNIVYIYNCTHPQKVSKDEIHNSLKVEWTICQTKWHTYKFKLTFMANEGRFLPVCWVYEDLVAPAL